MSQKKRRANGEGTLYHNGAYWVAQITLPPDPATGTPRRKSFYAPTRKQALEKLTTARYRLQTADSLNSETLTLAQWSSLWLQTYKKNTLSPTTYAKYQNQIESRILPALGRTPLSRLTPLAVQQFVNSLSADGLSDGYVALIFARLSAICRKATQLGFLRQNPCTGTALPKTSRHPKSAPLTKLEQAKLLAACQSNPDAHLYLFLLGTGCRIGEALALTWADIHFDANRISIQKTAVELRGVAQISPAAKTRAGNRRIPMSTAVQALLQQICQAQPRPAPSSLVFPSKNGRLRHASNTRKHFKKICAEAQIRPITLHTLRHTFATRALENGMNIKLLSTILGHKDITITLNTYAHILDEYQSANLSLLDAILTPL